jgi:hypothetical protein
MDLDYQSEMIILWSILSSIFEGSWGSFENCLEPKIEPPLGNLVGPNPCNAL